MDRRDAEQPAIHDALRAIGRHVTETGAERVLISTGSEGQFTVLYMQSTPSEAGERRPERSETLSADEVQQLVTASRGRRGTGRRSSEAKITLETVLRAGGEALEEAGRRDFTLLADETGMVSLGPHPSNAPIQLTAAVIEDTERERVRTRAMRQAVFHPGQTLLYQPRGAAEAIVVVVQRLGTHQITVRLPGQEVLAVHRKWLRTLDAPAPLVGQESSQATDLAFGDDVERVEEPFVNGTRASPIGQAQELVRPGSSGEMPGVRPPLPEHRDRDHLMDTTPTIAPAARSGNVDHFDAALTDEAEALRSVAEKLEEARQARAWLIRRHRGQQSKRETT
jgi:hypothetical protein